MYSEGEYYHDFGSGLPGYNPKNGKIDNMGWRRGLVPMWYPTHSAAYYTSITGGRFMEVSCLGTQSLYAEFQKENNSYQNPFGTEVAMYRTSEGGISRMVVGWDLKDAHGEKGRVYGQKSYKKARVDGNRPPLPPGVGGGGHGGGNPFGGGFGGANFSDIFEDMFGGGFGGGQRQRSSNGAMRGNDLQYATEISLEDAYEGIEKTIKIPVQDTCDGCKGSGAEEGTSSEECPTCHGAGRVRAQQGFFTIERACHTCAGAGTVIKNPCKACGGAGRVRREKTLKINIPKGIDNGRRIRLTGEGEAGVRGGPAGDLYVLISVKSHKFFRRDGANLYCRVPITMTTAALGGEVEVPTVSGKRANLKVPSGTQTGQQMRMREKGMPVMQSNSYGDMYIEIFVETPVNLNSKQKAVFQKLNDDLTGKSGKKHSPESSGFFDRMKDLWADLKD